MEYFSWSIQKISKNFLRLFLIAFNIFGSICWGRGRFLDQSTTWEVYKSIHSSIWISLLMTALFRDIECIHMKYSIKWLI